jgi:molybdate transport system ATP-binding protein
MLRVDVAKALGAITVEAAFASEGGVTALFGPSGAGKTSLINMIAGLLKPDRGRIELDGESLDDIARRIHVPAHQRRIGYVFQDARLFPHLSVAQNLDYGRRMNGLTFDTSEQARIVHLLDLEGLLQRRPGKLSGGEKQRVALGRALLSRPRLLLMDEPLGSLDEERKSDILPYLIRLRDQAGVPMVYVSHDAGEVRRLATQVIRVQGGKIIAQGGLEALERPSSPLVVPAKAGGQ